MLVRLLLIVAAALLVAAAGLLVTASSTSTESIPEREVSGGHPDQGRRAIVKYGCGGCHQIAGVRSAKGKVGPPLSSIAERTYLAGRLPNTPDNLVLWIMNPQGVDPDNAMPNLGVLEQDARSIAAYLYGLE